MSEPRVNIPTPEAVRAARRLARQIEWSEGFWLAYIFTIDANQAASVRESLIARGAKLQLIRPQTPEQLQLAALLEAAEGGACVWVESIYEPDAQSGAWTDQLMQLILRANERRELLRERLRGGLVLVMHPSLKPDVRAAGPDLWSVRAVVFELPAGTGGPGFTMLPPHPSPSPPQFVDIELLDADLARWRAAELGTPEPVRARTLLDLADRLQRAQRYERAAEMSEQALAAVRKLAQADPATWTSVLVQTLEMRAADLNWLGHGEEAIELLDEAAQLFRGALSGDVQRDLYFAHALYLLGAHTNALGRFEQAEPRLRQAASIMRGLLTAPGDEQFVHIVRDLLASTLIQLGVGLVERGRLAEALEITDEASGVVRELATMNPEIFESVLIGVLNNSSVILGALGRNEEALDAAREAVTIGRAQVRRGLEGQQAMLALSLYNLGIEQQRLGRQQAAVETIGESVRILDDLLRRGDRSVLHSLAVALISYSGCLFGLGQHESARAAAARAVEILRELANQGRPHPHELAALGAALHNLARALVPSEDWQQLQTVAEQAVTVRRQLVTSEGTQQRRQLAQSLALLATAEQRLGTVEAAIESFDEALRLLGPVVGADDSLVEALTRARTECQEALQSTNS